MKRVFLFIPIVMISCVSDSAHQAMKYKYERQIVELESQLDDCKNGPSVFLHKIKKAYEEKDYQGVLELEKSMSEKHQDSPEYLQVITILKRAKYELEKVKKEKLKSLNKLKKQYDDVSNVTWYYNPYFTHYNNITSTSVYIGSEKESVWLRIKMSYYGDDWIFFDKAYLSYDGNTLEIDFDKYSEKKTDNSSDGVWEWIDVSLNAREINFLKKLSRSTSAKMRLSGKYTKTKTLTWNERNGILEVVNGYEILTSQ